jgi:hypothetical protein
MFFFTFFFFFFFFFYNLSDFISVNILVTACFFVSDGDDSGCYEKGKEDATCESGGFTNKGACESNSNGVNSPESGNGF